MSLIVVLSLNVVSSIDKINIQNKDSIHIDMYVAKINQVVPFVQLHVGDVAGLLLH